MVERGDHAAAPLTAGGRQLDGLGRDAGIQPDQVARVLGHAHDDEARGALTGEGTTPVLEGRRPFGHAEQTPAGLAGTHEAVTQLLGVTGAGGQAGAVHQPFQIRHLQRTLFFETAAGTGRQCQLLEIHMGSAGEKGSPGSPGGEEKKIAPAGARVYRGQSGCGEAEGMVGMRCGGTAGKCWRAGRTDLQSHKWSWGRGFVCAGP